MLAHERPLLAALGQLDTGQEFTAKDFRTWAGTMLALCALQQHPEFDSVAEGKRNVVAAVESVARTLGNTKAVCRRSYVHPALIDAYLDGGMTPMVREGARRSNPSRANNLRSDEAAVLAILKERLARDARRISPTPAQA